MSGKHTMLQQWSFPFCPTPAEWNMDWQAIQSQFSWLQAMEDVPQSPVFHAEGNVLIHTRMVAEALIELEEWRDLSPEVRTLLFAAALLHDVAKSLCTLIEENGHISSRGHAHKGEKLTRQILWRGDELEKAAPFAQREYIAQLVNLHGLPLQFLERANPERAIFAASQSVRMDHLALLAEADVRGRICADKHELLAKIDRFLYLLWGTCTHCLPGCPFCHSSPKKPEPPREHTRSGPLSYGRKTRGARSYRKRPRKPRLLKAGMNGRSDWRRDG